SPASSPYPRGGDPPLINGWNTHARECANLCSASTAGQNRVPRCLWRSRVAQSAEHPAVNRQVIGSSPIAGATERGPGGDPGASSFPPRPRARPSASPYPGRPWLSRPAFLVPLPCGLGPPVSGRSSQGGMVRLIHSGKVRDVYEDRGDIILVASDRVSVFDVILPTPIPDKGKVLTRL